MSRNYDYFDERVRPPEIEKDRKPFTRKELKDRRKKIETSERLAAGVRIPRVERANRLGATITHRSATAARDSAAYSSGLYGDGNNTYGRGSRPKSDRKYRAQVASGVRVVSDQEKRRLGLNAESYDAYDMVVDHLLDEGYADTYESAEAIMVGMSEEWMEEILSEADSLAAQQARRAARQRANMKKHGTPGFDYSKPHAQAAAEREAQFQKFIGKKKPTSTNEAFNIFVNTLIREGMNLDNYSWDDLRYAFNDIFLESSQANRDPDKYEHEKRKTETRGQTAERRVRSRLATMDPEARKKMEAQMRAVGLNV